MQNGAGQADLSGMAPTSDPRANARGPITPAQLDVVAVATMDPLALYRVEGPGRYRHEWIDSRALRPGFPEEDAVIGRCFHEVFAPEITERFHEAADRAVATGRTVRYLGSSDLGTYHQDIEVTVAPHFAGDTVQLITSVRDIRDRMALDRERDASHRRVQKLMEHAPHMVWLIDERGTILYATGAIQELLGYTLDEVVGQPSIDLVHKDGMADARVHRPRVASAAPGEPFCFELQLRHRDGSPRWVECTLTNRSASDISDRRQLARHHRAKARRGAPARTAARQLRSPGVCSFSRRITDARCACDESMAAVLYIDFDGLAINDTLVTTSVAR
jgi:PAS domain S-box-containing protein